MRAPFCKLVFCISQQISLSKSQIIHKTFQYSAMSTNSKTGVPLKAVIQKLESFAEPSLASSWDNVGLLIEPTEEKNVSHILLTNDLTENVMKEALDLGVNMIISYHPPIFSPLKNITTKHWKQRIVAKCLENKIALYSPHTSFDSIEGGVNDWLAQAFEIKNIKPIEPSENPKNGMGRYCVLKHSIDLDKAVELVKTHCGLQHVKLAKSITRDSSITTVALCAGSGGSILKAVSADLYLTGEMLHHDVLEAVHNGASVILTNHSNSERGFLKSFATTLTKLLGNDVLISVSKLDADPLLIV